MKRKFRFPTIAAYALALAAMLGVVPAARGQSSPPDLQLQLTAPATGTVNTNFNYTIQVTNIGGTAATGVTVTDVLDPAVSFISAPGCSLNNPTGSTTGGTVTCSLGTLAGGTAGSATITVKATAAGTYSNVAGAVANETDAAMADNSGSGTTSVGTPPTLAIASIALAPSSVVGGNTTVATVTLTAAAPAGGASVSLSSSDSAVAAPPTSVVVPAGATTATASVATAVVGANKSCTISGFYGGVTKQATLTDTPITPSNTIYGSQSNPSPVAAVNWEIGTEFYTDKNGWLTGMRFYKATGENAGHTGRVWNTDTNGAVGPPIATVTLPAASESGPGWQEATFSSPLYILAGQKFVVSYTTNIIENKTSGAFFNNPPLYATRGCFGAIQGAGVPPDCSSGAVPQSSSNFWVDVRFRPAARTMFNLEVPASFTSVGAAYEEGTRFTVSQAGNVTALRFYKAPVETGATHTLRLWTDLGTTPLLTVTTSSETAAGWQEKTLTTPYPLAAGTYRVSYSMNSGESKTYNGLLDDISSTPMTATEGCYSATAGSRPATNIESNLFADVRFTN